MTSNVTRVFPFQTLLTAAGSGMAVDSKAHAEQLRSVSVERLGPILGLVPPAVMSQLDEAMHLHLDL